MFPRARFPRALRLRSPQQRQPARFVSFFHEVRDSQLRQSVANARGRLVDVESELASLRRRMEQAEQRLGAVELRKADIALPEPTQHKNPPRQPKVVQNGFTEICLLLCIVCSITEALENIENRQRLERAEKKLDVLENAAGTDARLDQLERDVQNIRINIAASEK